MKMAIEILSFPLAAPFAITGHVFHSTDTVRVTLSDGRSRGIGEAVGVYYAGETADSMAAQLQGIAGEIDGNLTGAAIQALLPPGGARSALDCAFWDYRAKAGGQSIWELLSINPHTLTTVYTLGMDTPQRMGELAAAATRFSHLKIKLDAEQPIERLAAIRRARPDADLIIDVNQGWDFTALRRYLPQLQRLRVAMVEQPLPRGDDAQLEGFASPVPLGADESCCHLGEFAQAAERYDVINIKLDKCGGLTEALALVNAARAAGKELMVGNMTGTSLSMAPSYVIGQFCRYVDIDGPLLLEYDVEDGLEYADGGRVALPSRKLWG